MISLLDAATEGRGVYSVAEAARYAKVPAATIRNWFFPANGAPGMRRGDIEGMGQRVLSFYDFVELLAVRSLRLDYQVSLRAIREAIDFAQQHFGQTHLFARQDHQTLIDDRRQLHIILAGEADPVAISGREKGQQSFQTCVEMYMRDLKFSEHGLANLYTAFRFRDQQIVMNPAFGFGEPVLRESGYPAEVLWRAVIAEGGIERAALLYETSMDAVEAAYRYCNGELGRVA